MKKILLVASVVVIFVLSSAFTTIDKNNVAPNSVEFIQIDFNHPILQVEDPGVYGYADKKGRRFVAHFATIGDAQRAGCKSYRVPPNGPLVVF